MSGQKERPLDQLVSFFPILSSFFTFCHSLSSYLFLLRPSSLSAFTPIHNTDKPMFQSTRSLLRGATATPLRASWSRQQQALACSRPAARKTTNCRHTLFGSFRRAAPRASFVLILLKLITNQLTPLSQKSVVGTLVLDNWTCLQGCCSGHNHPQIQAVSGGARFYFLFSYYNTFRRPDPPGRLLTDLWHSDHSLRRSNLNLTSKMNGVAPF